MDLLKLYQLEFCRKNIKKFCFKTDAKRGVQGLCSCANTFNSDKWSFAKRSFINPTLIYGMTALFVVNCIFKSLCTVHSVLIRPFIVYRCGSFATPVNNVAI